MIKTVLCDLLGIDYPIIQGGMSWISTAELVAAVSEAGGYGLIGAGNAPPDWVREQIQRAREMTDKPFGVNLPLISPFVEEVIGVCVEEEIPAMTTGGGNPGPFVPAIKEAGMKFIPVVASVALARRLERMGADAIIAEGTESGGHIGDVGTMPLVPQVVDAVKVPVVAAGGIADGRGLVAALALGAVGIQMGTRFICSDESIAHINYKQKIVRSHERATMVTGYSLGHPVRAIRNPMAHSFEGLERQGASEEEVIAFGTGALRKAAMEGDMLEGSIMAGQICGMIHDIRPVKDIIDTIIAEAERVIANLPSLVG